MMEASGLAGATATVVVIRGLLGAGIGYLVFQGSTPGPVTARSPWPCPTFRWWAPPRSRSSGGPWRSGPGRPAVVRRTLLLTPVVGLVIAALAIRYAAATGHDVAEVLFSGQNAALGRLLRDPAAYGVGALLLLVVCKGIGYGAALGGFRGAPHSRRCSSGRRAARRCRTCLAWRPSQGRRSGLGR